MNWLWQLLQRLRSSFSNAEADRDLDAEMESHLAMAIREHEARDV